MFMRIYWGRIEPGCWPDIEKAYRELNEIPVVGMRARWVTQDVNDPDNLFTITVWESADAVRAWESSSDFHDVFQARVKPFLAGSHTVSLCEIRVGNVTGSLISPG